jgi:hypothetical protein
MKYHRPDEDVSRLTRYILFHITNNNYYRAQKVKWTMISNTVSLLLPLCCAYIIIIIIIIDLLIEKLL